MSEEWFYYTFRCKVRPNSLYGKLCRFLKAEEPEFEEPEFTETEMVLEANSAYNLPLVFKRLKEIGKCSELEFKHCGRVSFFKLIQRAYFVAQICGLEGELELLPFLNSQQSNYKNNGNNGSNGTEKTSLRVIEPTQDGFASDEDTEQTLADEPQELLHHQDDETLDNLFGQQ